MRTWIMSVVFAVAGCGSPPNSEVEDTDAAVPAPVIDAAPEPVVDAAAPVDAPDVDGAVGDGLCRDLQLQFTPTEGLQIVAWIEDSAGTFVETLFITDVTGRYGLGNRPGIMRFNSAYAWPNGRRTTTFPVWAHRHGIDFPRVEYQNGDESNLSHPLGQSSPELFYCRPLLPGERMWDTMTCATTVYTDKGKLSTTLTSQYPPRSDLTVVPGVDDPSVAMFASLNPLDHVSAATPAGNQAFAVQWTFFPELPAGDYVAWVEVAKEFDQNVFYDYPAPVGIPWSDYGLAYRGQPSVLYRVDVQMGKAPITASTDTYEGYGDPDGLDGNVRAPDNTINTGIDGSGAARLLLISDGMGSHRVRASLTCATP